MEIKILLGVAALIAISTNCMEQPYTEDELSQLPELAQIVESPSETFIEACKAAAGQVLSLKHIVIKNLEANQINIEDKVPAEVIEFKNKVAEQTLQIKALREYNCPKFKNFYLNLINNWQTAKTNFPEVWGALLKYMHHSEGSEWHEKELIADALLFKAVNGNSLIVINLALALGANVNYRGTTPDYTSNTPLINAVRNENKGIVKVLLQAGADIDAQGENKRTALINAAISPYQIIQLQEIQEILINSGADLNIKDDQESTALRWAIVGKYTKLIQALIKAGADPNIKDRTGENALFPAIRNRLDAQTIQMLIDGGADINAQNFNDCSPLMVAKHNGYKVLEQTEKKQKTTCCVS